MSPDCAIKTFAKTVGVLLLSVGALTSTAVSATPDAAKPCNAALQSRASLGHWELDLGRGRTSTLAVTFAANRSVLLLAQEHGVDVDLEVSAATTTTIQAGNPVRRNGVLRALVSTDRSGRATIAVRATAEGGTGSRVTLLAYDNEALPRDTCQSVTAALAAGDAAFARARLISDGRAAPNAGSAPDLWQQCLWQYERAFAGLAPENLIPRARGRMRLRGCHLRISGCGTRPNTGRH